MIKGLQKPKKGINIILYKLIKTYVFYPSHRHVSSKGTFNEASNEGKITITCLSAKATSVGSLWFGLSFQLQDI